MNRKPTKPTGLIGPIVMSGGAATYEPLAWPKTKAAIEEQVLQAALVSARRATLDLYGLVGVPVQNDENHFDFTLPTEAGKQYLDLMELQTAGGPYSKAPGAYVVGQMADAIWKEIERKSDGYGSVTRGTVHLLLYVTDWRFRIGSEVTDLLSYWSLSSKHGFASIVYFAPDNMTSGQVIRIHPRRIEEFAAFNEAAARDYVVMNGNPSAFENGPSGSVEVPLIFSAELPVPPSSSLNLPTVPGAAENSRTPTVNIGFVSLAVPLKAIKQKS